MRVITLGAGHRGTGKSFLTAHLGLALARLGVETYVADLDFRAADLHLMLGMFDAGGATLRDYLDDGQAQLSEAVRSVPRSENLRILLGSDETIRASSLGMETMSRMRADLSALPGDVVLVDLQSGADNSLIDLFLLGDDQWVVARRDPASLRHAANFLRRARLRTATRGSAAPPPTRPRVYTSLDDLVRDMSALKGETDGLEGAAGRRALLLNRCRQELGEDAPEAWLEGVLAVGDEADGGLPVIAEVPEDQRAPAAVDGVPTLALGRASGPVVTAIRQLAESIAADVHGSPAEPAVPAASQPLPI